MKKSKRRLKRSVRKTIGALFLASSVIVAAIPTGSYAGGEVQAANSCTGVIEPEYFIQQKGASVTATAGQPITEIPKIDSSAKIYTTADQTYYFAYVNSQGYDTQDTDKFAIITGYNASGAVDSQGSLNIPSEVMSYRKLSDAKGYCLTSVNGEFLFYRDTESFTTIEINVPAGGSNPFVSEALTAGVNIGVYNSGSSTIYQFLQKYTPAEYREQGYYLELEPYSVGVFENAPVEIYDETDPTLLVSTTYTYNIDNIFYNPCTHKTESIWKSRNKATLYYAQTNSSGDITGYDVCSTDNHQYADAIPIRYIANQFSEYDAASGTYVLSSEPIDDEHPGNGIFAGTKGQNIVNIVIPESMEGIGDYAFYGCTALKSITLSNQLVALGNHCFDGCRALSTVNMAPNPRIDTIGAYAFANCPGLTSFYVPHSIKLLCDGVFENDTSLVSIDLTGDINADPSGNGSNLTMVGNHLFYGCSSLETVIFGTAMGSGYSSTNIRKLSINIFEDCPSLKRITVLSPYVTFADDTHAEVKDNTGKVIYPACQFTLVNFHDLLVSDEFYFEAKDPSGAERPNKGIGALHETCQTMPAGKEFTFKYFGEELYEKTVTEKMDNGSGTMIDGGKAIYQVNNNNSLVFFTTEEDNSKKVESLSFPEHFGPYYINEIPAEKFHNLKNLTTVKLPSTINIIGDRAFQGCINLQYVYFNNDQVQIGTDAFRTQGGDNDPCPTGVGTAPSKQLYFVTTISEDSTPFAYAMSEGGRFNHNNQTKTWPIIYSGFPTLLEVQYNPDKQCAELTNFPTADSLSSYTSAGSGSGSGTGTGTGTGTTNDPGWYLNDEEKAAITHFLAAPTNPTTSYDHDLKAVCETLTIPRGVRSIKDGLFDHNTSSSNKIAVVSEGLTEIDVYYEDNTTTYEEVTYNNSGKSIDVTYDGIVNIDPSKGDFGGCEGLLSITFQGNSANEITIPDYAFYGCPNLQSVTISQRVDSIGVQAFSGCDSLTSVELYGVKEIKEHAFYGDDNLSSVTVSADTTSLGIAPFRDCGNLNDVNFGDNQYYTTANSIIYALDSSGTKYSIIEVLGGKNTIQATDVKGITGISEEAFADSNLQIANFEGANIFSIPERAFDNCNNLVSVYLPEQCEFIGNYAFRGSALCNLTVNAQDIDCFSGNALDLIESTYDFSSGIDHGSNEGQNKNLSVFAPASVDDNGNVTDPSRSYRNFEKHKYLVQAVVPVVHYYVTYWDFATVDASKRTVISTEEYEAGALVTVKDPIRLVSEGFIFQYYENRDDTDQTFAYRDQFTITSDIALQAVYEGVEEATYTATFYDTDPDTGAVLSELMTDVPVLSVNDNGTTKYYINSNQIAYLAPAAKDGYTFQTWTKIDPRNNVYFTIDQVEEKNGVIYFYAKYKPNSDDNGGGGGGGGGDTPNPTVTHLAKYYMPDGTTLLTSIEVKDGDTAYNIEIPEGYTGYEWSPKPTETVMKSDQRFVLVPSEGNNNGASNTYTATYYYSDGVTVYQTLRIEAGGTPPDLMMPAGYAQCKWSPDPTSITMEKNLRFTMVKNPDYVEPSPSDPNYTGPYYTLTVVNGSGSGSYKPGAQVIIIANDAKTGTEFSSWTSSPASTPIASRVMSATVVTMPSENVTVTANFVASTSNGNNNGSNGTGSGSNNGNNGNGNTNYWPSTGNVARSSGTTVVIEKNGLSNTGVVSATVNGSTDNFTIKITQSQTADRAVLDALLKKYGSVDNLVYFPMDISLYDAAGTTQIRDTSGLTITITLPLPDSMIQYAANNKVAVISNGEIDGLNAKFTTINGVACVTFTCTHFSPYVIYVNTVEMTSGGQGGNGTGNGGLDNTPKTADFIHPKWFVSLALFAISIVLFLMKDKKTLKPVKANNGGTNRTVR